MNARTIPHTFLPRRRPCFECSMQLYYVKGKGYYAVMVEDENGNTLYMHKQCAEQRNDPRWTEHIEDILDAKQERKKYGRFYDKT